ncbi:MAG: glycosyl hydrolase [Opitutaceae bacterium]
MARTPLLVATLVLFLPLPSTSFSAPPPASAPSTPVVQPDARPWTRWWWPGSAVDATSVTQQLEQFARAGLGGVEITPIYGAKGYEDRTLPYLSPAWMDMLAHTVREAHRLGLGVDMATGTGWPFGGPWVTAEDGAQKIILAQGKLTGEPTRMKVKRAAPGAEGLVVDPYSPAALQRYLAPFSAAFAPYPKGFLRGQFHDSFEYYHAGWTASLPAVFQAMHGYDLQAHAAALMSQAAPASPAEADTLARLKGDYRATLSRLHAEFLQVWLQWSHERGFIVRNQSHGSPANLLDLYGAVDIPETETFGSTPFPIPGLRREWSSQKDLPDSLVIRMASSAAHVMGRPLASSETCTWLREHWQEALAFAKPEIDRLFTDGINHIFYHGTVFSPQDAPWPGWLFYASTQFNPQNPWWDDFAALNAYVARVQSVVQSGQPDNDVLLYWPFADVLHQPDGLMKQYGVHDVAWLRASPFGQLADALLKAGFAFDSLSDAQLVASEGDSRGVVTPGGHRYRVLLVPATRHLPVETLHHLVQLVRAGVAVHLLAWPEDVPGLGRLEERRARFHQLLGDLRALAQTPGTSLRVGAGDSSVPGGLDRTWLLSHVTREAVVDSGLSYIRRAQPGGYAYFFTNLTGQAFDGWTTLGRPALHARLTDPLTGRSGRAALRPGTTPQLYLQLAPGESLLLHTSENALPDTSPVWTAVQPSGAAHPLNGTWTIEFIQGGPTLPGRLQTPALKSWTDLGDAEAVRFAGTARYRLEFDRPAGEADTWLLDLGDVRESARVTLNGQSLGTAWSLPFRVRTGPHLKPGRNVLELEVTNLAANRIRDMDQRGLPWKIMHEINFVNIDYKPFNASAWPLTPSGLLGPVTLTPLRNFTPR